LQKQASGLDIVFIGTRGGMEAELVGAAGLRFIPVLGGKLRRLPGAGIWRNLSNLSNVLLNLRDLVLLAIGLVQCLWLLARLRPAAVFNKVGPAGLPVGLAAAILRIPMVLHEPDVTPGLGNRILSRWASAVAVGFPPGEQRGLQPTKLVYTGTPVQAAMLQGTQAEGRHHFGFATKRPLTLVVGGSQGAQPLNDAILGMLPGFLQESQFHIISGRYDHDRVVSELAAKGIPADASDCRVDVFLDTPAMALAYAAADVVVARGGASTLSELAARHKAVIVVPNHRAAAHQLANAAALERAKAVLVAPEDTATLQRLIYQLLGSAELRRDLGANIQALYHPNAAAAIATLILKAAGQR
jgi:UDP-N-acetylglucosamine--N-acetylmuramyl-(pentapeptide) pyrophosphoryl-undecaprenol N-acetylglucosamine transferase